MFTGIIQNQAKIETKTVRGGQTHFKFRFLKKEKRKLALGESIAVNGVCLTVVKIAKQGFESDAVRETLQATTLNELKVGDEVNTERALCYGDAMGGHFVTGHVDGIGEVQALQKAGKNFLLTVKMPKNLKPFVAVKGSIVLDGISLTVQEVKNDLFSVALVPHTLKVTHLEKNKKGDSVNIEVDLVARYLHRLQDGGSFSAKSEKKSLSIAQLKKSGF